MAVLDGVVQSGHGYATVQPPQFSPLLDDHTDSLLWGERIYGNGTEPWQRAGQHNDRFLQTAPGLAIDGIVQQAYSNDYYYRIHIIPALLDLGNVLSSQTRTFDVWNSWFVGKLLSAVTTSGMDGITLTEPAAAPTTFAALEVRQYSVMVDTDGPPGIDALIVFEFPAEQVEEHVTGSRVTLWAFCPRAGFTEKLAWKTDIIGSFRNEQRLALRTAPRQGYQYRYSFDAHQYSRARAMVTKNAQGVYGVPVWAEATRLPSLSAGATYIDLDTTTSDYRENDLIVIWAADDDAEAVETTTVTATRVNLKLPLARSWGACRVMPLRLATALNGMDASRPMRDYAEASMDFTVVRNADLSPLPADVTYRSAPVMLDCPLIVSSLHERISRDVDVLDNESGVPSVDVVTAYVRRLATVSLFAADAAAIWRLRRWFASRRGKQKAFWLPSGNHDLTIVAPVGLNATSITVRGIGWPLFYDSQDIMIVLNDGTRHLARISSATTNIDGNDVLAIDGALTTPGFQPSAVESVQFMMYVRQDADSITLEHNEAGHVTVDVPVLETPEA